MGIGEEPIEEEGEVREGGDLELDSKRDVDTSTVEKDSDSESQCQSDGDSKSQPVTADSDPKLKPTTQAQLFSDLNDYEEHENVRSNSESGNFYLTKGIQRFPPLKAYLKAQGIIRTP